MAHLPSPPFLTVPGVQNFRDIGGYALKHPLPDSVRRGYLYRSAATYNITEAGEKVLRDVLGIKTVYDLRSAPEIEKQANEGMKVPRIEGIEYVYNPAFPNQDFSPEALAVRYKDYKEGGTEGFVRAYADILANAGPAFQRIFEHIRDHPDKPLLLHCSAGKDRTGVIAALILSIAGADDETIADEYALTEKGIEAMKEMMIQHLAGSSALEGDQVKAEKMVAAKKDYMLGTLQMIREKYVSAEEYVKKKCGQSEEDFERIRKHLRSDAEPVL